LESVSQHHLNSSMVLQLSSYFVALLAFKIYVMHK